MEASGEKLFTFSNGDTLWRTVDQAALVGRFTSPRRVLSTAEYGGGQRDDMEYIFNLDYKRSAGFDSLRAVDFTQYMRERAECYGLDPRHTCGLVTGADMAHASIVSESYDSLSVTAAVTGGIDINGGRVGDPASWHESGGASVPVGTINIMLFIGASLPYGTLSRALVTCTEAKTAALQELLAPSLYSSGIATGSGTDGTIIVCDTASPLTLTWAGKHSKLGELIGHTVMRAVKEALCLHTGLSPLRQYDVFERLGRFGITKELCPALSALGLARSRELVMLSALYAHVLDELTWGLIDDMDALCAANALLAPYNVAAEGGDMDSLRRAFIRLLKLCSGEAGKGGNIC